MITAATEWEAAEARRESWRPRPAPPVATHHTEVLDRSRPAGHGPARALEASDQRATAQVLPLFLDAICGPIDVHAIAAFLDMGLTTSDTRTGTVTDLGVVPPSSAADCSGHSPRNPASAARRGSGRWRTSAPTSRPGPTSPWTKSRRAPPTVRRHTSCWTRSTSYLRTSRIGFVDGVCDTAAIIEPLDWLAKRLRNMGAVFEAPELLVAGRSVTTAIEVLGRQATVSERELQRILEDCGSAQPSPLAGAEAAEGSRVPSPALIRNPGPVVWWGAVDDGRTRRRIWTPEEVRTLAGAGVDVPDPGNLARLTSTAELAGLCRATTWRRPAVLDGAATTRHPALSFAAHGSPGYDEDESEFTARRLVVDGTWNFGGADLPLSVPEPFVPDADALAANASRREVPPGTHLLPDRLSYSQMEKLLVHRLEWLLAYPLRIRQGWVTDIPTGNRMIGTFLHAIIEKIVEERLDGATSRPCDLLRRRCSPLRLGAEQPGQCPTAPAGGGRGPRSIPSSSGTPPRRHDRHRRRGPHRAGTRAGFRDPTRMIRRTSTSIRSPWWASGPRCRNGRRHHRGHRYGIGKPPQYGDSSNPAAPAACHLRVVGRR